MKTYRLFLSIIALFGAMFTSVNAFAEAEPIRISLNADNLEWVKWNSSADKTVAWGSQLKTIYGPPIYITHTNNNMYFWNGTDLQFYALVGSSHPQNYVIAVVEGYKILEVGCDFIVGTHPSARPSTAEYGVSLSINGEEAVVSTVSKADYETGAGTPSHAEAKDISENGNVTQVSLSVDFVADEALNGQNNALFVNTIGLYVIIEPLEGMEKAIIDLQAAFNKYNVVDNFVEGTDPGCYPLALISALETALSRADYDELEFSGELETMTEDDIRARITDLEDAYNALVAAKIPITLPDGYYRIRTRTMYTNTINTGEVDGNSQPITRDESMYKYIRNVIGENEITSRWQNRTDKADDEALMLFQLTNKDGFVDLMNVATETRFKDISASGKIISSQEADGLLFIDAYETADNETSVFIRMAEKKDENNSLHQSGHGGGTGVSGTIYGWYAIVGNEAQPASLWVFEAVPEAEVQDIMEAYIPVKERNEMLVEYNKIYADAAAKIEVAKDPIIGENGLITSADQLSSPWTESSEGSLEALIDGNPSSYWHSAWSSGNVANHTHYLQVALPDGDYSELTLQITRRPVQNDHVTLWGVYGSNDPEAADEAWEVVASLPTPFGSNTKTINTKGFETKGFKYLRFYIDGTTTGRGYGHASEFQLFPISQNPNSQYAKLGEIATTLDAIVKAQADKEEDDITKEDYETLKSAYDAFIGQIVDPTELRLLLAQLEGKANMIVIGTQPGFWKNNSTAAAFNNAYDAAKAYNEAGVYTHTESEHHVATLTRLSNTITDAAIGIKEGKWYRFRFGTEDEYDQYGWDKGPASESILDNGIVLYESLFGKYLTIGNVITETVEYQIEMGDGEGDTTTEDKKATKYSIEKVNPEAITIGQGLVVVDDKDFTNADYSLFRFIGVGDSAYMIQNKATGLFIKTGTTGHAILSVHPSLFNVSAMGFGANAIKAESITGEDNNYLHIQARGNSLVTWNNNTPGSNSTLYIEEAENVASNYDGSSFKISLKPGSVNTFCFPIDIAAREGMFTINRINGNKLVLEPIATNSIDAGSPFIFINGETDIYDNSSNDDFMLVPFKHGYNVCSTINAGSLLRGTYHSISIESGNVIAKENKFVIIKNVMQDGLLSANQAYISKENTFNPSEPITIDFVDLTKTIEFADSNVKVICVANWDTNGDGELSEEEAASVTNLNTIFKDCSDISSFDELHYFTGLAEIGMFSFANCSNLKSITIPDNVTTIDGYAFMDCNNLTEFRISKNSEIRIDDYAFNNCSKLSDFYILSSSVPSTSNETFTNVNIQSVTLHVLNNLISSYNELAPWNTFGHIVGINGSPHQFTYIVDGNEYKSYNLWEEQAINPEPAPIKEGYTFSGWSELPKIMPANDVTVIGSFTVNKYKVNYIVDGETFKTIEVAFGTNITPESIPTKEGYSFSGWSELPATMPAEDITVTGAFTINYYTLTYMLDGEIYKSSNVTYGTRIMPESSPQKEGYTFSGWSEISSLMPANDVTVIGTFTINKYKLNYVINDELFKTEEIEYGASITPEDNPTKEGYTFSGWSEIPSKMPADDVTVTGRFTVNLYSITYMIDEEVYKTESVEYGAMITPPNVPNNELGYRLTWESYPNTMPANDITIIGNYIGLEKIIEVYAKNNTWAVLESIGIEDARDVVYLTIKGTINGYDVMAMRNRMPNLQVLDLSEARVVANDFKYYDKFYTKNDVITAYFVPKNVREIILPKNIKSIDGSAFRDCSKLTDIVLPENITRIGEHTFDGCSSLKGVNIPKSVTSIEDYAFKGCETLTEIRLPAYLKDIGDNAFDGCTSLKNIYALMSDIVPIGQHSFNDYENQTLYVPEFLFNKYFLDARWNQFLDIQTMEINPGDYEVFTTNSDTEMSEDDQRIPHKEDGEAIDASIQREGSFTVQGEEPQDFATVELISDGEGRSGSLIGDDNGEEQGNVVVDDLVYRVSVEAETEFQYTPPVDLNIDEDFEYPEGQYKWWYFDGSDRARLGSSGRKPLEGKILKAHQGYVFMAQRTGILVIHLGKTAVGGDRTTELQDYEAEEAQNQGWNFMGNPYASYYDMSECTNTSPVTVWNAAQLIYEALRPGDDDFYLQPFQSFYVQKQDEVKGLKFDAVSRKSYRKSVEEKEERRALRRAKGVNPERRFIDLYIEVSGQQADHTRLVANASAKAEYEIGVDAAKFMSEKAAAQIYTLEFGVEMAINERPLSGSLPLGYTAAKAGRMTIGASRMDAPLVLVDRQTGVTCDLSENAYEFTTTEGTFNDRFLIRAQGDDGIGALAEKTGVLIAIREGGLAVGGAEGKEIQVYSIDGKAVASQSGNGFISLKPNIYIVGVDGITAKVRIRK